MQQQDTTVPAQVPSPAKKDIFKPLLIGLMIFYVIFGVWAYITSGKGDLGQAMGGAMIMAASLILILFSALALYLHSKTQSRFAQVIASIIVMIDVVVAVLWLIILLFS